MIISFRLNDEDGILIKKYAKIHNLTVSEFIRQTVMEHIEDEYELLLYNQAIEEYKTNPTTYSIKEIEKTLENNS